MRLSEWRASSPRREALSGRVLAVLEPTLAALGGSADPDVWVIWGDDPAFRFTVLVPSRGGLGVCVVRPNVGGDAPRAAGKLVRWSRVQLGDLDVDAQSGHRLATLQVEGQVIKGVDADADRIARFAQAVYAAADGRELGRLDEPRPRGRRANAEKTSRTGSRGAGARTSGARASASPTPRTRRRSAPAPTSG